MSREYLAGNWQYCNNVLALSAASLFSGLLIFSCVGFPRGVKKDILRFPLWTEGWETDTYTGCNRRNGPDFGRVFLMLNYTEKPQNTYIQSSMVTEI